MGGGETRQHIAYFTTNRSRATNDRSQKSRGFTLFK